MQPDPKTALLHGLADALGFVGGALLGWGAGRWLGYDLMAPGPWTTGTLIAWVLLIAGLGAGKWLSMRWRTRGMRQP